MTTSPSGRRAIAGRRPRQRPDSPDIPRFGAAGWGRRDQSVDAASATDDLCTRFCAVLLTIACAPDVATCQAGCTADSAGACAAEATADYECEAALTADGLHLRRPGPHPPQPRESATACRPRSATVCSAVGPERVGVRSLHVDRWDPTRRPPARPIWAASSALPGPGGGRSARETAANAS